MNELSRRDLFSAGLRKLLRLPFDLGQTVEDQRTRPRFLRPPGAVPERELVERCTTCGDCVVACAYEAIRLLDHTAGPLQGTPAVIPREQPCLYCGDFPCVESCSEGALTREHLVMGQAVVDVDRCLMQHGAWCDECVQKCPFTGKALRFEANFRLVVDPEHCTGCGVCEYVCPMNPPAIWVQPRRLHSSAP